MRLIAVKKNKEETLERISKRWRESVDKVREFEIVEEEEKSLEEFVPLLSFGVDYQEYKKAQRLKRQMLKKYKYKRLEDVIDGYELKTKKGTCYCIKTQSKIRLSTISPQIARNRILSDLKLIYGIGEVTEQILKEEGYKTIVDLIEHPRLGNDAKKFLELLNTCDTHSLVDWITHWLPKSHPLVFCCSALYSPEDFVIFDLETMGLFTRPIILLGAAKISGSNIFINQYLLRDIKEEPAALMEFQARISEGRAFITFNGCTFDVPYLKERLVYYRMKGDLEKPHFDILHFSRRAWKERVPNCRLDTLEKYLLGIERKDDVPSALVPDFYETYLRTKNVGPLVPIVEHNKQDLITLANIFSKLHEEWK
jgi:hypothetical protein